MGFFIILTLAVVAAITYRAAGGKQVHFSRGDTRGALAFLLPKSFGNGLDTKVVKIRVKLNRTRTERKVQSTIADYQHRGYELADRQTSHTALGGDNHILLTFQK